MLFNIALNVALVILGIGLIHRFDRWFLRNVGTGDMSIPPHRRFAAGIKAILKTLFSAKIFGLIKVVIVDILLQGRIFRDRKDPLAWLMHFCIVSGFVLLLLFHALGNIFATRISSNYLPTLNPFLFLRDLFGFLLLVGLILAVVRRNIYRKQIRTTAMDVCVIGILTIITLSGFLLQALKITSDAEFTAMVGSYSSDLPAQDVQALRAYWMEHYGLVPAVPQTVAAANALARGQELHQDSCAGCHSEPRAAFVSYPISRIIKPAAAGLDRHRFVQVFRYIHFLSCFLGLPFLAFSKMFHVVGTPLSLMVAEVTKRETTPAAIAVRQVIELDGCSHGGACHDNCPVRKRRLERIEETAVYGPMLGYISRKSPGDLGSRPVSG